MSYVDGRADVRRAPEMQTAKICRLHFEFVVIQNQPLTHSINFAPSRSTSLYASLR